ncbi:hypothetical protein SMMN14_04605 [Sphaerulina musiva]
MPRSPTDYRPWRDFITSQVADGVTQPDIIRQLATLHGVAITPRTLRRKIAEWGLQKQRLPRYDRNNDIEALHSRVAYTYHVLCLADQKAVDLLRADGFNIGLRRYRRLRKELGLTK